MSNEIKQLTYLKNRINKSSQHIKVLNFLPIKYKFLFCNVVFNIDYNIVMTEEEINLIKGTFSIKLYLKLILLNKINNLSTFDISNIQINTNSIFYMIKEIIENKGIRY